jgi:hypothetical protein
MDIHSENSDLCGMILSLLDGVIAQRKKFEEIVKLGLFDPWENATLIHRVSHSVNRLNPRNTRSAVQPTCGSGLSPEREAWLALKNVSGRSRAFADIRNSITYCDIRIC